MKPSMGKRSVQIAKETSRIQCYGVQKFQIPHLRFCCWTSSGVASKSNIYSYLKTHSSFFQLCICLRRECLHIFEQKQHITVD